MTDAKQLLLNDHGKTRNRRPISGVFGPIGSGARAAIMTDYFLCGWRVHSELNLPELAPWSGDDRQPDVVIRLGEVPERLDDLVEDSPFQQIDRRGNCMLRIEKVAAYLVTGPHQVIVAPRPGVGEAEIRVFLLSSVFGYLCHLRGLFPLHGSCVAIGGKAVAFCGPSGAGKSTTAVQLALRGHRLLADDVCVIDAHAEAGPQVLPAFPRLKLWEDTLAAFNISREGLDRNRFGQDKYHYRPIESFLAAPVPLGGVFLLRRAGPDAPEESVQLSRPAEKIAALSEEMFRPREGAALGKTPSLLAAQGLVAGSTPIWRLTRRFDLADMDRWLRQIETLIES